MKSPITTHVLDTAAGRPAAGVPIVLELEVDGHWKEVGSGTTDDDGRLGSLISPSQFVPGVYRITFNVDAYFLAQGRRTFYREVPVIFRVVETSHHYHVPLLLSPYGYSTYRGS